MQDSPCFDVGDDSFDLVADLVDGGVVGLCEEPDMSVMLELSADL